MRLLLKRLCIACSIACYVAVAGYASTVVADDGTKQEIDTLKKEVDELTTKINKLSTEQQSAAAPPTKTVKSDESRLQGFLDFLKSNEFYGNIDVSVDDATKGLKHSYSEGGPGGPPTAPVGKLGWLPGISTNATYFGVRGVHALGSSVNLVYQLETQVDVTAMPGTSNNNSSSSSVVKGGLASRTSYLGFASPWGAIKAGKGYAPYKTSTDRMNPFNAMLGDYSIIMGNTGGDNRVEFGGYLDHSIWYESPKMHGFSFNVLVAPGQNRAGDDGNIAQGESDCTGGNVPGSGALPPSCNDGSFGTAYSANLAYEGAKSFPLYVTAAYELHRDANRISDVAGPDPSNPNSNVVPLDPRDVGNEWAAKIGVQYIFPTRTTVSAIWENLHRQIPEALQFQNERSRRGTWLAVTQGLTDKDTLSLGWAHAGKSPGDPGQHNSPTGFSPDNEANMFSVALKHSVDKQTTIYGNWAFTANQSAAHYDLGAGPHGLKTDCHDASTLAAFDPTTGTVTGDGPRCFAGGKLMGVSVGVNYKF
ncbi:MAG: Porin, Gram-negative type [Nevskia sp.]|nr:Porin, Gram-negative type [Nevskia sp.]